MSRSETSSAGSITYSMLFSYEGAGIVAEGGRLLSRSTAQPELTALSAVAISRAQTNWQANGDGEKALWYASTGPANTTPVRLGLQL